MIYSLKGIAALEQHHIKNIIFDLGDVLIEYRWKDMLVDYGLSMEEAIALGNKMFDNPLWHTLDLGTLTDDEVINEYAKLYPDDANIIEYFIKHGEYMHVARPEIWDKVHRLKTMGYHIYLLSNYSEGLFMKHTKDAPFMNDIDGKVVSYQIHQAKPDKTIYQYLLKQYDLIPDECVFLDDRIENTKAASDMGIRSFTVVSKEYLSELLAEWIESGIN